MSKDRYEEKIETMSFFLALGLMGLIFLALGIYVHPAFNYVAAGIGVVVFIAVFCYLIFKIYYFLFDFSKFVLKKIIKK